MSQNSAQPSILYVDDLQTNLILFKATFEKDYNIILADSAQKAIEIIKEQEIQVLVTDQRMPDMTGTELLEVVAVEYPDIRRFLLTAFTDFETVVEAVNKGHIHGYINKPLQADEVRLAINNSLEVYDLRKKNTQILGELEKVNRELLDLDGLKSEIINVISQELRNPLNRIMGTLHMLKDKIESQELINVVNILDSSVSKLEDFSSMTEQISILKSPGHKLKEEEVKLKRVIEYGVIEASEEMRDKSIELDILNEVENGFVKGEFHLLVSCFVNLLKNGIDHMGEGESLTIRVVREKDGAVCEVTDRGSNYSEQLFEDLTEQFTSSSKKLNLNLGMELGLSQMIMEAHDGSVVFKKTKDQHGSVSMVFSQADYPAQET